MGMCWLLLMPGTVQMNTETPVNIEILRFSAELDSALDAHMRRHCGESGRDGIHFMPFEPDDPNGPGGISVEKALMPHHEPGWQRWFCARDIRSGDIVGHVDLKQDGLRTGSHRCELGTGVEQAYRGKGVGRRLMNTAIAYARGQSFLHWIDLRVFANNTRAREFYLQLGFVETGVLRDRFRIGGESIDDVLMVLDVFSSDGPDVGATIQENRAAV